MTARKKNDLRSLIEEARDYILNHDCDGADTNNVEAAARLTDALSLLPDADESASNWQEFDSERKETWPKEPVLYNVTIINYRGERESWTCEWSRTYWNTPFKVVAYQPLPPPYHPKEDVEIKP